MMKVVQVIPAVYNESDGVNHAVRGMSYGLVANGASVELHCLDAIPETLKTAPYKVLNYKRSKFPMASIGRSPEMKVALKLAAQDAEIIHSNGLWRMPNIYPEWAIRGTTCKLVVQPHGTLSRWAMKRSWWKKMPLWWLWQKRVLDKAALLVATCEKEYREIRDLGYKQPIAIIPIGLKIPALADKTAQSGVGGTPNLELRTQNSDLRPQNSELKKIVFFGRIHKVKAVDHLVKAWGQVQASLPDWELVIAGPDCGAKGELEAIIAEGKIPRVRFVDEINGQAKYDFLTEADLYVLPSHTENFGVTVAEALVCGTPVIASQGTPWQGLETEGCGKWVPIGVDPLVAALRELTSLSDEARQAMGQRGVDWIRRDFSWEGIGAKMKAVYAWLLGQGEKPEWVRVD